MNRNLDVVAQGIAAIGPYKRFIAARRRDADEEAAQIKPKESASPPAPLWGSGSTAPLPFVTHTEEAEAEGAESARPDAPRATTFAPQSGSEREVPPEVQATPMPITPIPPPTGHPSVEPETTLPLISVPLPVADRITPHSTPLEGVFVSEEVAATNVSKATVLPEPTTVEEAWAQFEATWYLSQPEKLPGVLREVYDGRDRVPNEFAQKMIGASLNGFLPEALEAAVIPLIRFDPHFQEADVLSRKSDYASLFEIELQAEDYHADDSGLSDDSQASVPGTDDSPLPGEADRAALRGDDPF